MAKQSFMMLRRNVLFSVPDSFLERLTLGRCAVASLLHLNERCFHRTAVTSKKKTKSEWRMFRRPCNTELRHDKDEWIKERRAFGGRQKVKAIWKNRGFYTLQSKGLELEVPILDVVHSDANKNHIVKKILVRGTIVEIDGTAFKSHIQENKSTENAPKLEDTNVEAENHLNDSNGDDQLLTALIDKGKLIAKITTRPGQDGLCNGYILEGAELKHLMEKLSLKESLGL